MIWHWATCLTHFCETRPCYYPFAISISREKHERRFYYAMETGHTFFFFVIIIIIPFYSANGLILKNNGYEDLRVVIQETVPENDALLGRIEVFKYILYLNLILAFMLFHRG